MHPPFLRYSGGHRIATQAIANIMRTLRQGYLPLIVSMKIDKLAVLGAIGLIFLAAAACEPASGTITKINVTQAYQTVSAHLTQDLATAAQITPLPSLTPAPPQPTPVLEATLSPTTSLPRTTPTPSPTLVCDRAAAGNPFDITIPDDTTMQPGLNFTKIWRLQNVGTCTWTTEYAVRFFYGSQMDAPDIVLLKGEVNPGQSIEIAVDMIAPETPGSHQGNWKLSNARGQLFGLGPNGDAPFWVRINVLEPPTATPTRVSTATATPTTTPTMTATPEVQAGGSVIFKPSDALDLDSGEMNEVSESDVSGSDVSYQIDASNLHLLLPLSSAIMGVSGSVEPGLLQCQTATKSAAMLALESLPPGTYLCYQTNQELFGWLLYTSLNAADGSADFTYRTWAAAP